MAAGGVVDIVGIVHQVGGVGGGWGGGEGLYSAVAATRSGPVAQAVVGERPGLPAGLRGDAAPQGGRLRCTGTWVRALVE
jgi:hypothetical protein